MNRNEKPEPVLQEIAKFTAVVMFRCANVIAGIVGRVMHVAMMQFVKTRRDTPQHA